MFKVSCIQLCTSNDVEYNLKRTKKFFLQAVRQKTNFVLTPEVSSKISLNKKLLLKSASSMEKDIYLKEKSFSFEPEITIKLAKKKFKFFEVPITYNGRSYNEGKKIGLKDAFIAFKAIFIYSITK